MRTRSKSRKSKATPIKRYMLRNVAKVPLTDASSQNLVPLGKFTRVGRGKNQDLQLKSANRKRLLCVSRAHAIVHDIDGRYFVQDRSSCNGVLVNSQPILKEELHPLSEGDLLLFGQLNPNLADKSEFLYKFETLRDDIETTYQAELSTGKADKNGASPSNKSNTATASQPDSDSGVEDPQDDTVASTQCDSEGVTESELKRKPVAEDKQRSPRRSHGSTGDRFSKLDRKDLGAVGNNCGKTSAVREVLAATETTSLDAPMTDGIDAEGTTSATGQGCVVSQTEVKVCCRTAEKSDSPSALGSSTTEESKTKSTRRGQTVTKNMNEEKALERGTTKHKEGKNNEDKENLLRNEVKKLEVLVSLRTLEKESARQKLQEEQVKFDLQISKLNSKLRGQEVLYKSTSDKLVEYVGSLFSSLEELFSCAICLEMPNDPCTLSCTHLFCKACWQDWSKKSKSRGPNVTTVECPSCRASITDEPKKSIVISDAITLIRDSETKVAAVSKKHESQETVVALDPSEVQHYSTMSNAVKSCATSNAFQFLKISVRKEADQTLGLQLVRKRFNGQKFLLVKEVSDTSSTSVFAKNDFIFSVNDQPVNITSKFPDWLKGILVVGCNQFGVIRRNTAGNNSQEPAGDGSLKPNNSVNTPVQHPRPEIQYAQRARKRPRKEIPSNSIVVDLS